MSWFLTTKLGRFCALAAAALVAIGIAFLRGRAAGKAHMENARNRVTLRKIKEATDAGNQMEKKLRDADRRELLDRVRDSGL